MFLTNAKVQVKNAKHEVIASQDYKKVVLEGTGLNEKGEVIGQDDVEALLGAAIQFFQEKAGEKGNGVILMLKKATYGYDLDVRAGIRQGLTPKEVDPVKAEEKQVKDFMAARAAAGKPVTIEKARERVRQMMAMED